MKRRRFRDEPAVAVAFVIALVIGVVINSLWPLIVWLITALAADFDNGWRRARRSSQFAARGGSE